MYERLRVSVLMGGLAALLVMGLYVAYHILLENEALNFIEGAAALLVIVAAGTYIIDYITERFHDSGE